MSDETSHESDLSFLSWPDREGANLQTLLQGTRLLSSCPVRFRHLAARETSRGLPQGLS